MREVDASDFGGRNLLPTFWAYGVERCPHLFEIYLPRHTYLETFLASSCPLGIRMKLPCPSDIKVQGGFVPSIHSLFTSFHGPLHTYVKGEALQFLFMSSIVNAGEKVSHFSRYWPEPVIQ
jgi:hypothetical protein